MEVHLDRRARRHLKKVGPKIIRLSDDIASWALFLNLGINSAQAIQSAFTRMTNTTLTKDKRVKTDELLRGFIQRLLRAAHNDTAFLRALAESETHNVQFDDFDIALEVFTWIQRQLDTTLVGGPRRVRRDEDYWTLFVRTTCTFFSQCDAEKCWSPATASGFIAATNGWLDEILKPATTVAAVAESSQAILAPVPPDDRPVQDEGVVMEMPEGNPDDDFVSLTLEISVLDEDDYQPALIEDGSDNEVHTLWTEAFEARAQAQRARLALLDDLSEEPPPVKVEVTPWTDVHALIAMDARASREGIQDSNLLALLVDIGEVEHLLNLAARGDTDGVLEIWSAWIDPVRDRIREVDARLKELVARPAVVIETVVVQTPVPIVETPLVESEPDPEPEPALEPEPAPAPPPVPLAPELPPLPDGKLRELFREVYASLARLPQGTMNRQIARQLEDLRAEAVANGNPRSIRSRTESLHGVIKEFLDLI